VALGIKVELGKAPLLLLRAEKGFVMCGYLNVAVANSLDEVAARVSGVTSFDDVLEAEILEVSEKAKDRGIVEGITGREALEKMF
jgi:uncharacterized protein YunC (DUF1805 family)